MFGVLIAIEVIASILLILVVLMQSSKGGGLAGTFGGAQAGMVFGVRRTADFLTKATWSLAILIGVLCLVINVWFLPRVTPSDQLIQRPGQTAPVTPMQAPEGGQQNQQQQPPPPPGR